MTTNSVDEERMPQVGSVITHHSGRRFKVTRVLASGPFSDVFRVQDLEEGESYAMKVERQVGVIR